MLTCVYHPIDGMRVLDSDEADKLKASGIWFDSPKKAAEYRIKVESEMQEESKAKKPRVKLKEKDNEKSSNG